MDAIQLIRRDHREFEQLFKAFERAREEGNAPRQVEIVRDLVRELSVHAVAEEAFLYPALREAGVEDEVLEALEEHHATKTTLAELDGMSASARYAAKVEVLAESVRTHMREEERDLLPRLRRALDPRQLRELGVSLAQAKRAAPTRPHPTAPDTPPWNLIVGALVALLDRGRDAVRDSTTMILTLLDRAAERGWSAAREAMARARQRSRETAQRAASSGRLALVEVGDTAEALERRSRRAARLAKRTGREATNSAKRAAERGAASARAPARAAARGFTGEPRPVVH